MLQHEAVVAVVVKLVVRDLDCAVIKFDASCTSGEVIEVAGVEPVGEIRYRVDLATEAVVDDAWAAGDHVLVG